jgi:hypothetical protein
MILIATVLWAIAAGTGSAGNTYQQAAQLAGRLDAENRAPSRAAELKAMLRIAGHCGLTFICRAVLLNPHRHDS